MRKNIGTNKNLAKRREARENARKPIRLERRRVGLLRKAEEARQVALMNQLFRDAMRKRVTAEANGEVFEKDLMTELSEAAAEGDNEQVN